MDGNFCHFKAWHEKSSFSKLWQTCEEEERELMREKGTRCRRLVCFRFRGSPPARARSSSPFVRSSREGTTRRGKRHFVCECNVALHCSSRQTDRGKEGRRAGITFPQCEAVEDGASFYTISWLRLTLKKALCCVRSDIIHWQEWKQTRIGMRKSKLDLHSG